MDEGVYLRMLEALRVQHDPATLPQVREQAIGELEAFKRREDVVDYAMYVMSNPQIQHHDAFSRHFALQCLIGSAKAYGAEGQASPRAVALRSHAATLLTSGTLPLDKEAFHVKEGVAQLVADLAERAFPEDWPDFLDGLLSSWQGSGETAAELCMMALRNMAEDCTDSNFNARLSTKRRSSILRAVNIRLEQLLLMTFQYFELQFGNYQQAQTALAGGGGMDVKEALVRATMLLRANLAMLRRFLLWIRHQDLLTPAHDFVAVFLRMLPEMELRCGLSPACPSLLAVATCRCCGTKLDSLPLT